MPAFAANVAVCARMPGNGRFFVNLRAALLVRALVFASAALGLASPSAAQLNQPIYPAYDGFLQNPDGSYTLAFAYFSHNAETVTVAPGVQNSFNPSPGDRQQPITFKPGHWRFQCVMVVAPDFDGKLRWTVTYGGVTTGTSEHMLQSNWNLVEGAAELRQIDFAKAPKGVCLNRAPQVRVLGSSGGGRGKPATLAVGASVGERFSLFGSVNDEGLPRTGKLAIVWKQLNGPGTATFENAAAARTRARFSAPGSYELELTATDGELSASTRVVITVK
jgi:hypothetical protein